MVFEYDCFDNFVNVVTASAMALVRIFMASIRGNGDGAS